MFTPEELTAIGLSLVVAIVAALASLPPGIACGWLLARRRFPRQGPAGRAAASAPGDAASDHRLCAAGGAGHAGAGGQLVAGTSRYPVRLPLDRRGVGVRGHGISADGARDPSVHRSHRSSPGSGRRHAGGRAVAGVLQHHFAAGLAGPGRRHGARVRQGAWRVRRHHHLRVEYPWRNADLVVGHLRADAGPGMESGIWRLAGVALAISLAALLLSEWLVRRPHPREDA